MSSAANIRHILVPHDFSDTAERALTFALDLAEPLGAQLTVMHAYEILTYAFPEAVSLTDARQIERAARTALEALVQRVRRPGVEIDAVLREGTPWSEINAAAAETKADLIVMSSHRPAMKTYFLGSNAGHVVRYAKCSVLVVRR